MQTHPAPAGLFCTFPGGLYSNGVPFAPQSGQSETCDFESCIFAQFARFRQGEVLFCGAPRSEDKC